MNWLFFLIAPFAIADHPENCAFFKVVTQFTVPPEIIIQYPRDLVKDDEGNLYLLDSGQRKVFVWNAEGEFLRSFGQKGYGPGEIALDDGVGCIAVNSQMIAVVDNRIGKVHCWDRNFNFLKSITKPAALRRIMSIEPMGNHYVILVTSSKIGKAQLLVVDETFQVIETLGIVNDSIYTRNDIGRWNYRPFADNLVFGIGINDIWYANSNQNWIRRVNLKGEVEKEHRLPLLQLDLANAEKNKFIENFRKWRQEGDTISFPKKNTVIDYIFPHKKDHIAVIQFTQENYRYSGKIIHKDSGKPVAKFLFFAGENGFLKSLRGQLISVNCDENGEYQLKSLELVLGECPEGRTSATLWQ